MKLKPKYVEKPWGRTSLPPAFQPPRGRRIGELWFEVPEQPLLAKYLFTSERLSVQVHPDDAEAKARGLPRGKSECWYILEADERATLALGLTREVSAQELRDAATTGEIVDLLNWLPVTRGDFFYVEPGTIHAIGGGISLLEFQENCDVTYRMYDYGRPRELHLDDAIAVASRCPYPERLHRKVREDEDCTLVEGPKFTLVHSHGDALQQRDRWVMPLAGSATCGCHVAEPGECLFVRAGESVSTSGGRLLIGAGS